ncbi:MFS transporter [Acinetobacter larvae]|uniref:MFS transporter n=1 Tax=Acinetobacter larvae TaxID=1789224 RepID=A0A1B2M302_9GAMM|nr:MFS transporter [Acinetobacter larvae]AOA59511.1 MFS transporter [Acinetobacter larvae]
MTSLSEPTASQSKPSPSEAFSSSEHRQGSWLALITTAVTAFILVTSEFLPIGVLNSIAADLQVSTGTAGLVITLPGIMAACAAPLLPVFIKNLDRRYLLIALTAVTILANLLTAWSESFALLLLSRLVLGIAIGGFWATAIALSGRLAPRHVPIAKANAVVMAGVTFATVLGVPLGTWLSTFWGWRSAFFITAMVAILALILELMYLPKLKPQSVIRLHDLPSLFREVKARKGLLIILFVGLAHFSSYSYLAPFFKNVAGFSPTTISSLLLLFGAAGILGNAFAGYSGNINVRYSFAFVALCFAIVFVSFPTLAIYSSGAFILTALWGFAFGAFPTTANIWMFVHAPQAVEKGMPLFVGVFQVMIATGSLLGGYIVDHFSANILLYSVLIFVAIAMLSIFTWSRGLNNPKISCEG